MLVKLPPAKILPSACTAIEKTPSFAFGLNESANPVVASSRAMRLRVCPPMCDREIAARQNLAVRLHRDCTDRSFAFGSNESADPVVASSRAMRLRVCPPMLVS